MSTNRSSYSFTVTDARVMGAEPFELSVAAHSAAEARELLAAAGYAISR